MTTPINTCEAIDVEVEQSNFTINELAVGLAFFFGVIFGVVVLLICAKLCLKDFSKKKRQDAEQAMMEEQGLAMHEKTKIDYLNSRENTVASIRAKSAKKRVQSAKKKKGDEPIVPIIPVTLIEGDEGIEPGKGGESGEGGNGEGGKTKGLIDALIQPTLSAMEVEMKEQDLDSVNSLERELKEESIMTMIQLMRTLLGQQMNKDKLTQDQYKDIMKDAQDNVQDVVKQVQGEKENEEEEIKRKFAKDPKKKQEELDKLHGKYMGKMNSMLGNEREKMHKELLKKTDLDEQEIEAILAMYAKQMANMEHKLGVERARQAMALEERLAKRKQLAEHQNHEKRMQNRELDHHRDTNNKMVQHLVEKGSLTEKDKAELLKEYDTDVNRLHTQRELEYEKQKQSLADKLKRNREEKMRKLKDQQEKEQENFLKQSEKITGSGEIVEAYHDLQQQQRHKRDALSDELDNIEAEELRRVQKEQEREQKQIIEQAEENFNRGLKTKGLTDQELRRLMDIHEQEMNEFERTKSAERKKMKARLEEKLAQRRHQAEEDQTMELAEAQVVKEQQDATIKNVLDSQVELSANARDQIMKEHEQNMTSINNQLQMSKMRQKKAMEARLAARKSKVDDLKLKQEEVQRNRKQLKEKEKEKLNAQLEKQIVEEEQRLEADHKHALNELCKSMAEETAASLSEQEKQLSVLIGRLQVGQARRQAIISKQDNTIKELEDKMSKKVEDVGDSRGTNQQVDQILKDHYRQVSDLNNQMQDVKEQNDLKLRDKIEAKKLKKEREVEDQLENEAQHEWQEQKKRGALISTTILSKVMLENRHKTEIKRLEKEMQYEMQKQREKLNEELEIELQQELEDRKKSFLAQIAAISKMSKDEVNEMVDNVVEATGGDEKQAKKMRKEFNQDVKKAKSALGVDETDYPSQKGSAKKSHGSNNQAYEEDYYNGRPKSGKRTNQQPPRASFRKVDEEDDEDF